MFLNGLTPFLNLEASVSPQLRLEHFSGNVNDTANVQHAGVANLHTTAAPSVVIEKYRWRDTSKGTDGVQKRGVVCCRAVSKPHAKLRKDFVGKRVTEIIPSGTKTAKRHDKSPQSLGRQSVSEKSTARAMTTHRSISAAVRSLSRDDNALKSCIYSFPSFSTQKPPQRHERLSVSQGMSVVTTTTATTKSSSSSAAAARRGLGSIAKSGMGLLKIHTTAREGQSKSFIDSIVLCDDDMWQPPSTKRTTKITRKKKETQSASTGNEIPLLGPLPRDTVLKHYTEDVATFETNNAIQLKRSLPSQLSAALLQSSVDHLTMDDTFSDFARQQPPVLCSSVGRETNTLSRGVKNKKLLVVKKAGTHFLTAWNEPPANVFLSNDKVCSKEEQDRCENSESNMELSDVWCVHSSAADDGKTKTDWTRSLQSIGQDKRKIEPVYQNFVSNCSPNINDDDYHSIFYGLHGNQQYHPTMDNGFSEFAVQESQGAVQKFTNSFAARSALLQQPQQLLDSNFLSSSNLLTSYAVKAGGLTPMVNSSASERLLSSFFAYSFQLVELSYPAKVLYVAVLYLRALGGFPTLLRISPLPAKCSILEKEHCIELIFSSSLGPSYDKTTLPEYHPLNKTLLNANIIDTLTKKMNNSVKESDKNMNFEVRSVILRAVLAEKSVVERFGVREVVYLLPPLHGLITPDNDAMSSSGDAQRVCCKSDAVFNLLYESKPGLQRTHNAASSSYRDAKNCYVNCGDIAVVLLMSEESSKFTSVLPEPMDLEGMRYKVYGLRHHELDDAERAQNIKLHVEPTAAQRQAQQRWRDSFDFETKIKAKKNVVPLLQETDEENCNTTTAILKNFDGAVNMELMRQRFPYYTPVTVAESTLQTIAGGSHEQQSSECPAPYFSQLLLPRFYTDLLDAIQYAFNVQDMLKEVSVSCPGIF